VTGRIERGIIKVGEEIEIVGIKPTVKTICTGVEMFRKLLDQGQAGDNVGCCCAARSAKTSSVAKCCASRVDQAAHATSPASLHLVEGRRRPSHPFFNNYRPQFYFRTTDVTGSIELPKDKEMVMRVTTCRSRSS